MKRALVTGVTGMDGSHLAELLLDDGVQVHGLVRRTSLPGTSRIAHLIGHPALFLYEADLTDGGSLERVVREVKPDYVFNLAAQSFVGASFKTPVATADVTGLGALRLLEAVRQGAPLARFYQASSSEMWGTAPPPQDETTPFHPRSPYGVAKVFAHHAAVNYREAYGMHVSCGILLNHDGPRRGPEFLTRKVTLAAAEIRAAIERGEAPPKLLLGNLSTRRDIGYAGDYVKAMWEMVQMNEPGDYVVATGESHSGEEWVEAVFKWHGLEWREHVAIDPALYRPSDVPDLCGDASKARRALGWKPTVDFGTLVGMMAKADWEALT